MTLNKANEIEKSMSIDGMLSEHVGEFGRGQLKQLLIVGITWILEACSTYVMIFSEKTPEWECNALSPYTPNSTHGFSSPPIGSRSSYFSVECNSTADQCQLDRYQWDWVGGNNTSIVTQWDLICGNLYKVGLVQSLFFVGYLIGAGIFSHLSDGRLGRKKTLMLSCLLCALFNFLTSISPDYVWYAILRTFTGASSGGIGETLFVLIIETMGSSVRGSFTIFINAAYVLGIILLPILAYMVPYWRRLYRIISGVSLAYCLLVLPWAFESSRWLLVNGKPKEAMDVLVRIASENGKTIPEGMVLVSDKEQNSIVHGTSKGLNTNSDASDYSTEHPVLFDSMVENGEEQILLNENIMLEAHSAEKSHDAPGSISKLFSASVTRSRLLTVISMWFTANLVYAGLLLNVDSLGSNIYLNTFINGCFQMLAIFAALFFIDKLGRKNPLYYSLLFAGACCMISSLLVINPLGDYFPSSIICIIFTFLGMFAITSGFFTLYTFSVELFPTEVRNTALGLVVQIGVMGAILAPYVVLIGDVSSFVPYLIFGLMCFAVSVCVSRLPETHKQVMWETIEAMENSVVES